MIRFLFTGVFAVVFGVAGRGAGQDAPATPPPPPPPAPAVPVPEEAEEERPMPAGMADLPPRAPLPAELGKAARLEVHRLGQEVVKGNYKPALRKMYPRWKRRMAKRAGGMLKLEAEMAKSLRVIREQGIQIVKQQVGVPKTAFEVWPVAEMAVVKGSARRPGRMVYRDWVVFVPTRTFYRGSTRRRGSRVTVYKDGFQVAVTTKGSGRWHFIDGATVGAKELRALFPNLPADEKLLALPPVNKGGVVKPEGGSGKKPAGR